MVLLYYFFWIFDNISDERDRFKRENSWLGISLIKRLGILVGILFGLNVLGLLKEEMVLETSLQPVGEIKNEYRIVSSAIVEKYLLKALAIVIQPA